MGFLSHSLSTHLISVDCSLSSRLIAPTEICVKMNGIDYRPNRKLTFPLTGRNISVVTRERLCFLFCTSVQSVSQNRTNWRRENVQ